MLRLSEWQDWAATDLLDCTDERTCATCEYLGVARYIGAPTYYFCQFEDCSEDIHNKDAYVCEFYQRWI